MARNWPDIFELGNDEREDLDTAAQLLNELKAMTPEELWVWQGCLPWVSPHGYFHLEKVPTHWISEWN